MEPLSKGTTTKEKKETTQKTKGHRPALPSGSSSLEREDGDDSTSSKDKDIALQARQLFATLKEKRGWPSPKPEAEAKAIQWMLRHGYTAVDMMGCHDHMKAQPFWREKTLLMMSMQKDIGEWKTRQAKLGSTHIDDWRAR